MAIPIINLSILNGNNGFRLYTEEESDRLGSSVSNAGDVNGDGFDDVIVGAPGANPHSGSTSSGSSYVVFGKAGGFNAAENLSNLNGNNGFRLDGVESNDTGNLGYLVSTAGDINGDGFDDLIFGNTYLLASYVVFGKPTKFDATLNVAGLDGSNGFTITGKDGSGFSFSNAGDVNGDGFDDLIIGAPRADPNGYSSGSIYVVFGRASAFNASLDLSSLNGSNGFRLDGVAESDRAGSVVSSAGDVNGDGFGDVIVVSGYASYVVFGRASGFNATTNLSNIDGKNGFRLDGTTARWSDKSVSYAGDVNGDGFSDVIVGASRTNFNGSSSGSSYVVFGHASGFEAAMNLSNLDGSNGFRLDGVAESDLLGDVVSNAGDVNGDGFDDVIILAPGANASYVVFGKASGFDAAMNLSSLDGSNGFLLRGPGAASNSSSVSNAGDVNGDGFDDLIVGSYGFGFVVFGGNFLNTAIYLGTSGDDILTGTTLAESFEGGDGNDHMNGLGGADVFHGDAGDDIITVTDLEFQIVDGGMGNDTLELANDGVDLNLANVHDTLKGIETIDLTGSGDNTLTLTLADLLILSDTTNTFTVNGDLGDRVVGLQDGWSDGGVEGDYHIYTNQETVLRIDNSVNTNQPPPVGAIKLTDLVDGNNGFLLDSASRFVSNAGDVNGDGFDDVIVASGRSSYVVFGKASGFNATMNLSSLNGSNGFRLDNYSGYSVTSLTNAGDINGDGYDDVAISAHYSYPPDIESSFSYVVFGKANGFSAAMSLYNLDGNNGFSMYGVEYVSGSGDINKDGYDDVVLGGVVVFGKGSNFDAKLNYFDIDGSNGFRVLGSNRQVSNAGDINGDGIDDAIFGSSVTFGKTSVFDAKLDLTELDGSNGFHLELIGEFSRSVSDAGDFNGDGYDDLIVGFPRTDPNGINSGSSYMVFGKASGFSATVDLSSLDGINGFRLDGEKENDYSGVSVSAAGDVNGDGFDDVIIGASGAVPNYQSNAGSSYVVFGKSSGFDAVMDLSEFDGNNGIRLDGVEGSHSGNSVSGAGDINSDGFADLMVGTDRAGGYVIFGRSNFVDTLVTHPGTPGNDNLIGSQSAEIFDAGDGNDNMIGRGGADVFHGGDGDDNIRVSDLSFQLVDGGSGNDALHLAGSNLNLELANFDGKISGIESICIYGRGDNTLTLTAADLLNLSDTTNTLKVHGNAGDHITGLSSGWTDGGMGPNGYFHTYTQGDAVLLVGLNLTTDFV